METETEVRWYQIARDITWAVEWGEEQTVPRPNRVFERCLVTPDERTYICSATASSYLRVLDYYAEFDEDVSDSVREHWDTLLLEFRDEPGFYMQYNDVFDGDKVPKFLRVYDQGEGIEEGAFEYAQGNQHV